MWKKLRTFEATDDTGEEFTIEEQENFISMRTLDSDDDVAFTTPTGQKRLRTSAGEHVDYVSRGVYRLGHSAGTMLRSTDPAAP